MPPRRRKPPRAGAISELPPLKIIRSILLLQVAYYVTATVLILFTTIVLGQRFSLELIFDWDSVRGDNTFGWTLSIIWLLTGFITVIPIIILIPRSKLVPDFALTIHLFHLLITGLYTRGVPRNLLWWGLQTASATLMILFGVWACRYREMKPISFGMGTSTGTGAKKSAGDVNGSAQVGEGHVQGGAGGRRAGPGPSYEMVSMKEGDDNV